jgi:predicted transposase/invertase (TIGR01784 family)
MIINDPVCWALVHFENDLEKLEEKGELRGLEKGKIEGKIETARKMKEKVFSILEIQDITGLSIDQLRENGIL